MKQSDLNRRVARATQETVCEISRRGFSELTPLPDEPAAEDLILDWDRLHAQQNTALFARRSGHAVA